MMLMKKPEPDAAWMELNEEIVACRRCPRLVAWREKVARERRRAFQDWDYWGKPVLGFGDPEARLVILGLAPAAHGANRTGRMFTGNSSASTLVTALYRADFASQSTSTQSGDGLELHDVFLTAVARCAPPGNRPTPQELTNCRSFLERELGLLHNKRVILALGRIAFGGYKKILREKGWLSSRVDFGHGAWSTFEPPLPTLMACYHPSRQNTQTGLLTDEMLDQVFVQVIKLMGESYQDDT
jgi:uracil-DNA glycosylase family 4